MATHSIQKNIVLSDTNSATTFIKALENAASIATKSAAPSFQVKELRDSQDIKAFFGDSLL